MKTLIINGSPKKNGDTVALINEFINVLDGKVKILSCFDDISPCNDCRYCWKNSGCIINDEMQKVYPFLEECDNIVIASPIWFSSLSGPVLNIASRIQTLYASHAFRNEPNKELSKNGVIILVGAQPETEVIPRQNALTILKFMSVYRPSVITISSMDTNNVPASDDEVAKSLCRNTAKQLNDLNNYKSTYKVVM